MVTPASRDEYANESLARRGYLGTAPVRPSVAIAFYMLEAYRQLHYACPRLSIQAQVRALCRLHVVCDGIAHAQLTYSFLLLGRPQLHTGDPV